MSTDPVYVTVNSVVLIVLYLYTHSRLPVDRKQVNVSVWACKEMSLVRLAYDWNSYRVAEERNELRDNTTIVI